VSEASETAAAAAARPLEVASLYSLASLAAAMRAGGARVGLTELLSAHRALAAVDCASREDARIALQAVMCSGREDLERFARAFADVFGDGRAVGAPERLAELGAIERAVAGRLELGPLGRGPMPSAPQARAHAAIRGSAVRPGADEVVPVPTAWSDVELLRETDFAQFDDLMAAQARRRLAQLALRGPTRRTRRTRPDRRSGHTPDLRRIVRSSLRTGGEPVHRFWRAPATVPRRLVLICDVSGSMSPYARMLLCYLHACVAAHRPVEAFAFGTRLTRITRELSRRDPDVALERAIGAVTDYSGGTRIGAALGELNRVHGRRLGRGAVVVIMSDGWDRGDPVQLSAEIARLRRSAYRLIWLNPLAAHPDYEPLARGMRAAIPYTDELLAGNTLASLERLADIMEAA
jgi:uncharacterized protein with von Willebrand factor type A (vWA) domain